VKSVLILEDVSETLQWLGEIAAEAFPGCGVTGASTVRDALAAMDRHVFDLALIDLRLPDGSGAGCAAPVTSKFSRYDLRRHHRDGR
jgi:DNA-binding response OmpR family regulator